MSQDLRREKADVRFETIAGATNYIAEIEEEMAEAWWEGYKSGLGDGYHGTPYDTDNPYA